MTYSGPCELLDSKKRFVKGRIFLVAGHEEAGHHVGLSEDVGIHGNAGLVEGGDEALAKDVAMHIAATNPVGIRQEDVPEETISKEKEIYRGQVLEMGKPENITDKIVAGKLQKFFKENCMIYQAYFRKPEISIEDFVNEMIAKIGENISIKRFVRYQIGES